MSTRLEAGDGREQRDVGGPEAVGIERPIADRDHHVPQRPRRRRRDNSWRERHARRRAPPSSSRAS